MMKMYLENNNAGKALLITDGEKWIYCNTDSSGFMGNIDFYRTESNEYGEDIEITDEQLADDIRNGIETGDIYSAEDFFDEYGDNEDYYVSDYDGMTIDDIDRIRNYTSDGYPIGHDETSWIEI